MFGEFPTKLMGEVSLKAKSTDPVAVFVIAVKKTSSTGTTMEVRAAACRDRLEDPLEVSAVDSVRAKVERIPPKAFAAVASESINPPKGARSPK